MLLDVVTFDKGKFLNTRQKNTQTTERVIITNDFLFDMWYRNQIVKVAMIAMDPINQLNPAVPVVQFETSLKFHVTMDVKIQTKYIITTRTTTLTTTKILTILIIHFERKAIIKTKMSMKIEIEIKMKYHNLQCLIIIKINIHFVH